jgi:hypothetical protein
MFRKSAVAPIVSRQPDREKGPLRRQRSNDLRICATSLKIPRQHSGKFVSGGVSGVVDQNPRSGRSVWSFVKVAQSNFHPQTFSRGILFVAESSLVARRTCRFEATESLRQQNVALGYLRDTKCLNLQDQILYDPQQCLNFCPEPHGHGSFLPTSCLAQRRRFNISEFDFKIDIRRAT